MEDEVMEVQNETTDFEDDYDYVAYNNPGSLWVKVATVGGSMLIGALAAKVISRLNIQKKMKDFKDKRDAKKLEKLEMELAELRAKRTPAEPEPKAPEK